MQKAGFLMRNPQEGEYIAVKSYKHDGSLHRTWHDCMGRKTSDQSIIACNDHTLVSESDGRRWVTREPALLYFHKKYWFNIVTMIRQKGTSYYCNLASPYIMDKDGLKYIDYDLDIKVFPNGDKKLLDVDEYLDHGRKMAYPYDIDYIVTCHLYELNRWIEEGKGPFSKAYVDLWYERYCQLSQRQQQHKKKRRQH